MLCARECVYSLMKDGDFGLRGLVCIRNAQEWATDMVGLFCGVVACVLVICHS